MPWRLYLLLAAATVVAGYLRAIRMARVRLDCLGSRGIATSCGPVDYACVAAGCPLPGKLRGFVRLFGPHFTWIALLS